ncbi:uncharacterized protein [Lolium perenne]|uniref:uncharacterized protein n=1 Tax=Lolium perenne TaxID=4522 RepID=UPI003A99BE51
MDTLLKDGAPRINKNFVSWFMEKRNVDMIDELKCVSQGCSCEVTKYEKYDVNGFRFHTETHQKGRANPKTINTGVFTKGANNFDYYGRLQSVYELTFNRTNVQLNFVVFKCHWFDPIGGQRSDKSIGLVEVKPSTTYSGADVFVVAHQAKQVYYLPYPCQKAELKGWEVVFQVSPHGNLPIPSDDDYNNIDPPEFEAAYEACNEVYQQAAAQWNRQNTAYMAYIGEMMISMSTAAEPNGHGYAEGIAVGV